MTAPHHVKYTDAQETVFNTDYFHLREKVKVLLLEQARHLL